MEEGPAFLSSLSFWEVMIKWQKGMLDVGNPRTWWAETLDALCLRLRSEPRAVVQACPAIPLYTNPDD